MVFKMSNYKDKRAKKGVYYFCHTFIYNLTRRQTDY